MNAFGDKSLETITGWIHGLSSRQQAISNNIANIDTPGYTRQEVNFETALQRQIGSGERRAPDGRPAPDLGRRKAPECAGCRPHAAADVVPARLQQREHRPGDGLALGHADALPGGQHSADDEVRHPQESHPGLGDESWD